jgi:hypothetical protein
MVRTCGLIRDDRQLQMVKLSPTELELVESRLPSQCLYISTWQQVSFSKIVICNFIGPSLFVNKSHSAIS